MTTRTSRGIKRSTAYQLALFTLAVIVGGSAVLLYPDPKPAPPPPLPRNVISIIAVVKTAPMGEAARISPDPNLALQFYVVDIQGQVPGVYAEARTNSSGLAQVRLERGVYVVKFGDSGVKNIIVTRNATLRFTKLEVDEIPTSMKVLALSKDWQITPSDYVEVTYTNNFDKPILLQDAFLGGKRMDSVRCRLQAAQDVDNPYAAAGASSCSLKATIQPLGAWSNTLAVPGGKYVDWAGARDSLGLAIRISYMEVDFKPNTEREEESVPANQG